MLPFVKYSGAGNDFVLVEEDAAVGLEPARLAERICPRATGVGVDGLVLVGRPPAASDDGYPIRFFNPDGSEFSTCGNGSRCAARYVTDEGWTEERGLDLLTAAGRVRARVEGEAVELRYTLPVRVAKRLSVQVEGVAREATLVEIGTPHLVVPLPELPEGEIEELCRPLRHHDALGPEGANVNLVALHDGGRGGIRTFERGVEGETLACGSGAMAAALVLRAAGRAGRELALVTRSGATLVVILEGAAAEGDLPEVEARELSLRLAGPARRIFQGRFPASSGGGSRGGGGRHAAPAAAAGAPDPGPDRDAGPSGAS